MSKVRQVFWGRKVVYHDTACTKTRVVGKSVIGNS
jgi:hypothetical protein